MYLPKDETVRFELTSPDVIHSFWVPAFYHKMDVIPGRVNKFELTPNKLGTFAGKCTELCGADHSRMLFDVKVVSRAEYEAHIQSLRDAGQIGVLESGRTTDAAGVTK
jgi:cytochrome c oxidase subunit 2